MSSKNGSDPWQKFPHWIGRVKLKRHRGPPPRHYFCDGLFLKLRWWRKIGKAPLFASALATHDWSWVVTHPTVSRFYSLSLSLSLSDRSSSIWRRQEGHVSVTERSNGRGTGYWDAVSRILDRTAVMSQGYFGKLKSERGERVGGTRMAAVKDSKQRPFSSL